LLIIKIGELLIAVNRNFIEWKTSLLVVYSPLSISRLLIADKSHVLDLK